MEQMASRPFAGVAVELDAQLLVISTNSEIDDHRKKVNNHFFIKRTTVFVILALIQHLFCGKKKC